MKTLGHRAVRQGSVDHRRGRARRLRRLLLRAGTLRTYVCRGCPTGIWGQPPHDRPAPPTPTSVHEHNRHTPGAAVAMPPPTPHPAVRRRRTRRAGFGDHGPPVQQLATIWRSGTSRRRPSAPAYRSVGTALHPRWILRDHRPSRLFALLQFHQRCDDVDDSVVGRDHDRRDFSTGPSWHDGDPHHEPVGRAVRRQW